jgi:hypothetical protein
MSEAYFGLILAGVVYVTIAAFYVVSWLGRLTRHVERRRRQVQPGVRCRMKVGK